MQRRPRKKPREKACAAALVPLMTAKNRDAGAPVRGQNNSRDSRNGRERKSQPPYLLAGAGLDLVETMT